VKLALFDLDHTLLPIDSDHAWGQYTVQRGWRDPGEFEASNDHFYAQYRAGQLDIHAYIQFATQVVREMGEQAALQAHTEYMRDVIEPVIHDSAIDLVEQHRQEGCELLLVTATNAFITGPIAARFGIENLIAVDLQRDSAGLITGEILGTPSYQKGKIIRVEQWMAERGLKWADIETSYFYSDSINDLPLLEHVSHPFATNPDPRLRTIAQERGWPILELFA